ncbi:MAG: methyltransferase [Chitinophagales bacterium]|nr:methyltransferase [Bacteroidota bacterium]MCB9044386.1 methyltransferase [Chitinophagales bacterium]
MSVFRCKQFDVQQNEAVFKVNTDAMLLGAWTQASFFPQNILDIGTGTGVLALMMAQKFSQAIIQAIDISAEAVALAQRNFVESAWKNRLAAQQADVNIWQKDHRQRYDIIISNPPYFSQSILPQKAHLQTAKHCKSLNYRQLIEAIANMLQPAGNAFVIVPADVWKIFQHTAATHSLKVQKLLWVGSYSFSKPHRVLACLGFETMLAEETSLFIYNDGTTQHSEAYRQLTKDFHWHY